MSKTGLDIKHLGPHEPDFVQSVRWFSSFVTFATEARPMTDWLVHLLRSTKKPVDWQHELLARPRRRLNEVLPRIAKHRSSVKGEPFRMAGKVASTAAEMLLRLFNEIDPGPKSMSTTDPFGVLCMVVPFLPACSQDDPTLASAVVMVARNMAETPRQYLPEGLRPASDMDYFMEDMSYYMEAEEREAAATEIRDCVSRISPASFLRPNLRDEPGRLFGRRVKDIPHEHDAELVDSVCELVADPWRRQELTSTVGCFFSSELKEELESLHAELNLEIAGIVDLAFSCPAQGERPDKRTTGHSTDFRSLTWGGEGLHIYTETVSGDTGVV